MSNKLEIFSRVVLEVRTVPMSIGLGGARIVEYLRKKYFCFVTMYFRFLLLHDDMETSTGPPAA